MSSAHEVLQKLMGCATEAQPSAVSERLRAYAWARVSTGEQEERGLSIPEQFREIRRFAEKRGIEIVADFQEAASAYRHQERRTEFHRMLDLIRTRRDASLIIVHDLSRFGRDSDSARTTRRELERIGVRVLSVTDPEVDRETAAGVYLEALTYAKNEAYSLDVAFHTRKGCSANVQTRDLETDWCYKNGGQPLFGYRAERLIRGEVKRGRPNIKTIWLLDETIVGDRPIHEWARYCLVELAGNGASLDELRDFCHRTGIPGRRNKYWGISTWYALLQPSVLLQFTGRGVWNVHNKQGRVRPVSEWVIVEHAHPALVTDEEAQKIAEARRTIGNKRQFVAGSSRTRSSPYLLSGGFFRCGRCGANMIGYYRDQDHLYYVCGSQPYRKGMGCGPGVYVPQKDVESVVLCGLKDLLGVCGDPKGFTRKVNAELCELWEAKTGFHADAEQRLAAIDKKITNIRDAVENGLNDANWANSRLKELAAERAGLVAASTKHGSPPQIDAEVVMAYRRQTEKLFKEGLPAERKRLLRPWIEEVVLKPEDLEVKISYRLPEAVMNGVVAGVGFEPTTFGL